MSDLEKMGWVHERFAISALGYPVPARANRLDFLLGALTLVAWLCWP